MLALIAYALFLAVISALFIEHVMEPGELTRPVKSFEEVVREPPDCREAPDLYACLAYREAE